MKKLIDVSEYQGRIDWEKVKPHIDGAILRCGYGTDEDDQDDEQFKRNADECTRLGIPFGVYLYSYATNAERAKSEAAHVLRLVKDYKLSYPIYYDVEEKGTEAAAKACAEVFGDIIEGAGYWCGIYANLNWWGNYLVGLERYTKWVAQYNTTCDYTGDNLDMWQYTSSGSVPGISGRVDVSECYRDFPAEIIGQASSTPAPKAEPSVLEWQQAAVKDGFRFPVYGPDGKWGAECESVARLAIVKRRESYLHENLTRIVQRVVGVKQDGLCGPDTENAIKKYQKSHGLTADGCVGINTWKKILEV